MKKLNLTIYSFVVLILLCILLSITSIRLKNINIIITPLITFLFFICFVLFSFVISDFGNIIFSKLLPEKYNIENYILSTGLGIFLLSFLQYLFLILHIYNPILIWSLIVIFTFFRIKKIYVKAIIFVKIFFNKFFHISDFSNILVSTIFILLSIFLLNKPHLFFDTLVYHAALPKYFYEFGRLNNNLYNLFNFYPLNIETFVTMFMTNLTTYKFAVIYNYFFLILIYLTVYNICKQYFKYNDRIVLIILTVVITIPGLTLLGSIFKNDVGVAFYQISALYYLKKYLEKNENKNLFLTSIMVGISILSKYTSIYFSAAIFLGLLVKSILDRKFKHLIIYTIICIVFFLPIGLRNYMITKNPVYPAKPKIFGYGEYQQKYMGQFKKRGYKNYYEMPIVFFKIFSSNNSSFGSFSKINELAGIFFWLGILGVIIRKNKNLYILLFIIFMIFFFWMITLANTRYIYSIIIYTIIFSGIILKKICQDRLASILILILILCYSVINIRYVIDMEKKLFSSFKVCSGIYSVKKYLRKGLDYYTIAEYCNKNLEKQTKILFLGETRYFYFNNECIVSTANDKSYFLKNFRKNDYDFNRINNLLKHKNIEYILINYSELQRLSQQYGYLNATREEKVLIRKYISTNFTPIIKNRTTVLYKHKI